MAKKTTKDAQDVYAVWGTTQEEHQKQFMSFIDKMRAEAQERLDEMEKPVEKKKKLAYSKFKLKRQGQSVKSIKDLRVALSGIKGVKSGLGISPRTLVALKAQGINITGLDVKGLEEYALTGKIDGIVSAGLLKGYRKGGKKRKFRRGGRKGPVF